MSDDKISTLLEKVNSEDSNERRFAIEELMFEELDKHALKIISSKISDADRGVRNAASQVLISNESDAVPGFITPFVASEEISVRNLFEHPTLSDMAVFLQTHEINKQQNIQVMTGSAVSVLTTIQKQMLFIDHLNSGSSQYNLMASFKINGVLQIDCLKEALKTLIQRHKALRTIFVNTDGNMYAQLKGGYDFKLQTHDLTTLDLSDQFVAKEIEKLVKHDFDLTSDLLMKGVLFKTGGKHFILTLLFHHIAVDGWSLGLLTKELSELYNAYVCGLSLELPTESVEYADFANWQANWLTSNQFDEQKEYWIKKLKDVPNVHNLPLDRTRPVEQSHMGEKVLQRLNSDMKDEIMHFANEYGATLFMVLNAAFSSLLHRYSNENDIVVGTAVANRDKVEFSQVVGCFVNSLALRSQFSSDLSFTEHLQNTKETLLEAYDNQQFPFERLVEEINPERSLSYSPIFQIMLVLQNNENSSLKMQNVDVEQLDRTSVLSTFDLTLNVNEDETGLNLSWEFSTDVFDAATIERMAHHFENLLGSILACPNQKISKLNLLSENESDKLLNYWAGSEQDFPAGECIHDEIERHASICPNSIALIHEDRSLAYAELNQRANRLARHLISKGVKPDCLIGLFIKPSLEMVVGMLAIVKAGGAYLILDPSYPKERIGHLIDDSKVNIILSVTGLAEHPLLTKQEVELLDEERFDKSLEEYPSTNISREEADLCDSNVIYATYTSGSTGRPKGVLVQHKGLSNFVRDHTQRLSISNQSNVLQFGTVSFDGPASTIWLALFAGAKLCIGDNLEQQIDTELPLFIERNNVTHITMTPSALAGLRYIECIETVWVGGEVCPPSLVSYWKDKVKLFNVYGPSEATICSTVKNLNNTGRVTIGKPISNVFTFVLDNNLNPVPTGVAGELFIGGAGVSKGYMNHPALTLEKFIPNHLSKKNDDRLYKTGDLVRWSRDGELEYLGRLDNQVKIRGFRVELGEIEKAITELDFISEAIVSVLGESKKLVAYVISHDKKLISKSKLIQSIVEHLHLTLPDYMVPVAFSLLDNFPLTPNGKIDYKSLPEPKTNCDSSYRAPSTLNERLLCEIWQDLLQISKIGVNDNFFRLGGDSILAIQVVSRANQKGIYVTTKQLFENQTIFELALMS